MPCYSTNTSIFSTLPVSFQLEWLDAPWVKWARKGVPEAFVAGLEVSVTLPVAQRQIDFNSPFSFSRSQQPRCHWMVYGSTSKCSWPVPINYSDYQDLLADWTLIKASRPSKKNPSWFTPGRTVYALNRLLDEESPRTYRIANVRGSWAAIVTLDDSGNVDVFQGIYSLRAFPFNPLLTRYERGIFTFPES